MCFDVFLAHLMLLGYLLFAAYLLFSWTFGVCCLFAAFLLVCLDFADFLGFFPDFLGLSLITVDFGLLSSDASRLPLRMQDLSSVAPDFRCFWRPRFFAKNRSAIFAAFQHYKRACMVQSPSWLRAGLALTRSHPTPIQTASQSEAQ